MGLLYCIVQLNYVSLLPELKQSVLPAGDWKDGLVARYGKDAQPHFKRACRTVFPGANGIYVDYMEIAVGEQLRMAIMK